MTTKKFDMGEEHISPITKELNPEEYNERVARRTLRKINKMVDNEIRCCDIVESMPCDKAPYEPKIYFEKSDLVLLSSVIKRALPWYG